MKYTTHAARENSLLLFVSSTDKLRSESMAFPVNTVCLLQSLRASQRPIKAADLLPTSSLAHASAELSSKNRFTQFLSLRSAHTGTALSLSPLCLDSVSTSLHPEPHIERIRGLTSWSCESHLNRCSSWADTQASPCESMLLLQQERGQSGSRQWCDKLRFLIFILLIYSFPLLHCHPSAPHYPRPSATPPSCFPSRSTLWSGRPIAVVMREVNWPCCVFRRLDSDDGSAGIGGDNFLNFLWMPTCLPSAVFT